MLTVSGPLLVTISNFSFLVLHSSTQPRELLSLGWREEDTHQLCPHIMQFQQLSRKVSPCLRHSFPLPLALFLSLFPCLLPSLSFPLLSSTSFASLPPSLLRYLSWCPGRYRESLWRKTSPPSYPTSSRQPRCVLTLPPGTHNYDVITTCNHMYAQAVKPLYTLGGGISII